MIRLAIGVEFHVRSRGSCQTTLSYDLNPTFLNTKVAWNYEFEDENLIDQREIIMERGCKLPKKDDRGKETNDSTFVS
nr:hypothetical protein Iba_scaffold521505CG0020 [Ipomoea batatas]